MHYIFKLLIIILVILINPIINIQAAVPALVPLARGANSLLSLQTSGAFDPSRGDTLFINENLTNITVDTDNTIISAIRFSNTGDLGSIFVDKNLIIGSIGINNPTHGNGGGYIDYNSDVEVTIISVAGMKNDPAVNVYNRVAGLKFNNKTCVLNIKSPFEIPHGHALGSVFIADGQNATVNILAPTILSVKGIDTVGTINIGDSNASQKLTIDTLHMDMSLLPASQKINFLHKDSALNVQNTNATPRTLTFANPLLPTPGIIPGDDGVGVVEINAAGTGAAGTSGLQVIGQIGLDRDHRMKGVRLTGAGPLDLSGITALYTKSLNLEQDIELSCIMGGSDSTLDLASNTLTYTGQAAFTGSPKLSVALDPSNYSKMGKIIVGTGGVLDFSGADVLVLNINTAHLTDVAGKEYVIFEEAGGIVVDRENLAPDVYDYNARVKWVYKADNNSVFAEDNTAGIIDPLLPPGDSGDFTGGIIPGSPYDNFLDQVARLPAEERVHLFEDLRNPTNTTPLLRDIKEVTQTIVDSAMMYNMTSNMTSNITNSATTKIERHLGRNIAVAAGDEPGDEPGDEEQGSNQGGKFSKRYGLWVSGLYNKTNQEVDKQIAGYKLNSTGAVIGFDARVNDNNLMGLAASVINSKAKYKDEKSGDQSKIDSYILSLYSLHEFPTNFFLQGILSLSEHRIKNTDKRGAPSAYYEYAKVKYKSHSALIEAMLGYNKQISNVNIIPMAGIRYGKFKENAHHESNNKLLNISVDKKKYDRVEAVVGGKITFGITKATNPLTHTNYVSSRESVDYKSAVGYENHKARKRSKRSINSASRTSRTSRKVHKSYANEQEPVILRPEIHGFVHYAIKNNKDKIAAHIQGLPRAIPVRVSTPRKLSYNIGAGLAIFHNKRLECDLDYDAHLAHKSTTHQFMVRVRVMGGHKR